MERRPMMKNAAFSFPLALLLVACLSCASNKPYVFRPPVTEAGDDKSIAKPETNSIHLYENAIDKVFTQEITDFANIPRHVRNLTNHQKQAANVNAFDEVPNSTWFTNRNGSKRMSIDAIKRGPNRGSGPDTDGPLTIIRAKLEGVSAGFTVKDQRGDVYFLKFDPKGYPQMSSAAEVIATKFVYAAGYNTPENYLGTLDPEKLIIGENVTIRNRWGRKVPMTEAFVKEILARGQGNADGTYRVLASKFLEGEVLGPFHYNRRRKDDPNDHIRHEHRRELRGYRMVAAWLNNFDTPATNTLDTYVTEGDRRFVRHYLIDFGTALGSSGYGPASQSRGREGGFDVGSMLTKIFTLGLWVRPWEKDARLISPSVGYFEARHFDPANFKFILPNPAFQRATNRDLFWGAKIVTSFTDEQIRAVVQTANYANPEDEAYVIKTLIERRDKIGRYWFGKVNPLDNFRLTLGAENRYRMEFVDLAIAAGFESASEAHYRYRFYHRDRAITNYAISDGTSVIPIDRSVAELMNLSATNGAFQAGEKIFNVKIETIRGRRGPASKWTKVFFTYPLTEGKPEIIAIERDD